ILREVKRILYDPGASRNEKLKAAELLGKHLGMWVDKTEHSLGFKLEDLVPKLPRPAADASLQSPLPRAALAVAPTDPIGTPAANSEEPARERDVEVPGSPSPALAEFVDRFKQPETAALEFDPYAHLGGSR